MEAVDAASNGTAIEPPQWNSKPMFNLPGWAEPVIVMVILFSAMFATRRRNFQIFDKRRHHFKSYLDADSSLSVEALLPDRPEDEEQAETTTTTIIHHPKERKILGCKIMTPNTARFRNNIHSRLLQKFPFLIEMFYWILNYAFYRTTRVLSQAIFAKSGIWNVAEGHGIHILEFEEFSWFSFLFPIREIDVQQWFMHGHQDALSALNRTYALIHIPGTVGFIAWYYYVALSHSTFAVVRRTMTLTNFTAFMTFILYPCMPPRLLPQEYGFLDTVRHDDAQSIWMSGQFVNSLAAMPSMHFGYAFSIGCTFLYHSGIFRSSLEKGEASKGLAWKMLYIVLGIGYPVLILVTIVATANHYFLDALVATIFVVLSFACNKVFYLLLPVEDWFLWLLRVEKPSPTTGDRFREHGLQL